MLYRSKRSFSLPASFQETRADNRLKVRLGRLKDLPSLFTLFSLEVFLKTNAISHRPFHSLLSLWNWLLTTFDWAYVIELGENRRNRIIGFIGISQVKAGDSLRLSIAIFNPEDRGKGYGQKSLELLIDYLHLHPGIKTIYAEVLKGNVSSLHFFKKLGFQMIEKSEERYLLARTSSRQERVAKIFKRC